MKNRILILICFLSLNLNAQNGFQFYGNNTKKQSVKFKLINNLIVIPLSINGKELSFILDTGVSKTILFNLSKNDSLDLKSIKKITLQGLGGGEPIKAFLSKKNHFKVNNLISNNEDIYIILKDELDLSSKMGITIHGIIGYSLLKNVIIRINYTTKRIDFYNPKYFKYSKCKKCEVFPLQFHRNKPYVDMKIQLDTIGNKKTAIKMLIDSGGSDAIWLFENIKKEIQTPKKYFDDVLGEGISGIIYGKRSKIPFLHIGAFKIENPTVSFLDSISTFNARKFKQRNGSIGSNILKRFKVWIDYPNKQLTLKKCASLKDGFYYNMSGLNVIYNGKQLVKDKEIINTSNTDNKNTFSLITNYVYHFKPSFIVDNVVKSSPADIAGMLKGDIILKINGKFAHTYTLDKIVDLFQNKPNRKIKMLIERNGVKLKFEFYLKKRI